MGIADKIRKIDNIYTVFTIADIQTLLNDSYQKSIYTFLFDFVSHIDPKSVLSGLGEVLDESQKDWAKAKLVDELKGLIQRQIDIV